MNSTMVTKIIKFIDFIDFIINLPIRYIFYPIIRYRRRKAYERQRAREMEAELYRLARERIVEILYGYKSNHYSYAPPTNAPPEISHHIKLTFARLGLNCSTATTEQVQKTFRQKAMTYHSDHGGTDSEMQQLLKDRNICLDHLKSKGK